MPSQILIVFFHLFQLWVWMGTYHKSNLCNPWVEIDELLISLLQITEIFGVTFKPSPMFILSSLCLIYESISSLLTFSSFRRVSWYEIFSNPCMATFVPLENWVRKCLIFASRLARGGKLCDTRGMRDACH